MVKETFDDENEDILIQIQEEQRQFQQRFARRLYQVGKRAVILSKKIVSKYEKKV